MAVQRACEAAHELIGDGGMTAREQHQHGRRVSRRGSRANSASFSGWILNSDCGQSSKHRTVGQAEPLRGLCPPGTSGFSYRVPMPGSRINGST